MMASTVKNGNDRLRKGNRRRRWLFDAPLHSKSWLRAYIIKQTGDENRQIYQLEGVMLIYLILLNKDPDYKRDSSSPSV